MFTLAQVIPRQQRGYDELKEEITSALGAREGVERLKLALHVLVGLCFVFVWGRGSWEGGEVKIRCGEVWALLL